jgi:UDP-glucose 4-epimerase
MHCLVTGGAGFIGSTLVDKLLADGHQVTVYDNFSTGMHEFLQGASRQPKYQLVEGDILDSESLADAMSGVELVCHLAANANIRQGFDNPRADLDQNIIGTLSVLEAMRKNNIRRIAFSSSSAVYGDAKLIPTPEDVSMPQQISLYGAAKAAGEGFISAYCEAFCYQAWIFRFVSVLGERYTHGHVFDFVKRLRQNPNQLSILGDGNQRKSYMHVEDCVDAILLGCARATQRVNIFNLGLDGYITVKQSAAIIVEQMQLSPQFVFAGGERGWAGDSPFVWLDPRKIMNLGWKPKIDQDSAIRRTVDWLTANEWALARR